MPVLIFTMQKLGECRCDVSQHVFSPVYRHGVYLGRLAADRIQVGDCLLRNPCHEADGVPELLRVLAIRTEPPAEPAPKPRLPPPRASSYANSCSSQELPFPPPGEAASIRGRVMSRDPTGPTKAAPPLRVDLKTGETRRTLIEGRPYAIALERRGGKSQVALTPLPR